MFLLIDAGSTSYMANQLYEEHLQEVTHQSSGQSTHRVTNHLTVLQLHISIPIISHVRTCVDITSIH